MTQLASTRRERLLVGSLLVVLASLPLLIDRARGLVHARFDLGSFHIPLAEWWWSRPRLAGGWNPWLFAGYPANADPQIAGSHPFDLLALMLPAPEAFALEAVVTPALAGLGMWVYVAGLGAGPAARLVSALSFALGGFVGAHASLHPGVVRAAMAVPWVLAAIDACSGARLLFAVAAGTAAIVVAGHPQVSILGVGIVALYTLACGRLLEPGRAPRLLGGIAAGVGLAAPLWLPLAQLVAHSTRLAGVTPVPDLRLEPFDLYLLFAPFAAGGGVGPLSTRPFSSTRCGPVECATYHGLAIWLLLAIGLPALLRDRRARFWIALGLVSVASAAGAFGWLGALPALRGPARGLLGWSLATSVLGGMALSTSLAEPIRRRRAIALGAAAVVALVIAWLALRHPVGRPAALAAAAALALACVAVLAPLSLRRAAWLIAAVLAADLTVYRLSLPGAGIEPGVFEEARRSLDPLAAVMRGAAASENGRALVLPWPVAGNHAGGARVQLVQGYNPLVLRSRADLLGLPFVVDSLGVVIDLTLAAPSSHALDLLRVRVVSAPSGEGQPLALPLVDALRARPERFEPFEVENDDSIYFLNRRAQPTAWLVPRLRLVAPGSAIALVRDDSALGGFDPAREGLVEEAPAGETEPDCWREASPESSRVSLVAYEEDRVRLRTEGPCAGVLVTSELAYPGWEATLDGRPTGLVVVNGAFRGAFVPAGEHDVEMRYRPTLPWVARGISAASLAAVLAWAGLDRTRRR